MKAIKTLFIGIIAATTAFSAQAYDPETAERLLQRPPYEKFSKAEQDIIQEYLEVKMHELHYSSEQVAQDAWLLDSNIKKAGIKNLKQVPKGTELYKELHEIVAPNLVSWKAKSDELWKQVSLFNDIRQNSPECKTANKCRIMIYDIYNDPLDNKKDFLEETMFWNYSDLQFMFPYNPRMKTLTNNQIVEFMNQ